MAGLVAVLASATAIAGVVLPVPRYEAGDIPVFVLAVELNHDSAPDILTANSGDDSVSVFLGNGDGSLRRAGTLAVGAVPKSIAAGDINEDDHTDVVIGDEHGLSVSVYLGNVDGTFEVQSPIPVVGSPSDVALADLDSDTHLDLVTSNLI